MAGRRKLERERYWRGVIRKHRTSGLSVLAFCRKHGVAACSFYSWRRRLEKQQQEKAAARNSQAAVEDTASTSTAAKFVPVELHPRHATTRGGCEVVLPNGCRVVVPTQCDAGWLCEILGALQERAC